MATKTAKTAQVTETTKTAQSADAKVVKTEPSFNVAYSLVKAAETIETAEMMTAAIAGNRWKKAAIKHAIAAESALQDMQATFTELRGAKSPASAEDCMIKLERLASIVSEARQYAAEVEPTQSEAYAKLILTHKSPLLNDDEFLVASKQVVVHRYTKNIGGELVSVLFMGPLTGDALEPIGLIDPLRVKRFSDVRLDDTTQAAIAVAERKFCGVKTQNLKDEKLRAQADAIASRFSSARFTRI